MHFVCDVHISFKVSDYLSNRGHEAVHLNSILDGDKTEDSAIALFCEDNNRVLITKDYDIVDSYNLKKTPPRVIKINLGNISNKELIVRKGELLPLLEGLHNREFFLVEVNKNDFLISED